MCIIIVIRVVNRKHWCRWYMLGVYRLIFGIRFNLAKLQLICFGRCQSSVCTDCFLFCGAPLPFLDSVHLGHTLRHDLGDEDDIALRTHDMILKANCIMRTFQGVDQIAMTHLYHSLIFLSLVIWFGTLELVL